MGNEKAAPPAKAEAALKPCSR